MTLEPREFTILEHKSGAHEGRPRIYCPLCEKDIESMEMKNNETND